MPGDEVSYQNDQLFINGKKVAEPYLAEYKKQLNDGMPLTLSPNQEPNFNFEKVPAGKILVLGDNRRISKDTRSIGFIDENTVSGDVKFIFWPLKEIGFINK